MLKRVLSLVGLLIVTACGQAPPASSPIPSVTVAAIVFDAHTDRPLPAQVLSSCGQAGTGNQDGYVAWQVSLKNVGPAGEPALQCSFSAHLEGYEDAFTDGIWITGNRDVPIALTPRPPPPDLFPFPAEAGRLRIAGERFLTEDGQLWSWRGYSWFLGFQRFSRGDDVTPDLRWLRAHGVNIVRIFGPLPWKETPDYRIESFDFDKLDAFLSLLESYGLRSNWSLGHYRHPGLRAFAQRFFDVAGRHWSVVAEYVNEPHVGEKPDPLKDFAGVDRRGVPSSYGLYAEAIDGEDGWPQVLDFGTIHIPRDSAWHRRARIAQEVQHATGKPWISDEPAKITEPGFQYPGGKNDPAKTPAEAVWHAGIAAIYTAGSTLHTETGKWGTVPQPGMLQHTVADAVRDQVWLKISPAWQEGQYSGSHMSTSPVDFIRDIWTYSSIRGNQALSVRASDSAPPQAVRGWRVKERWGPSGSLLLLER